MSAWWTFFNIDWRRQKISWRDVRLRLRSREELLARERLIMEMMNIKWLGVQLKCKNLTVFLNSKIKFIFNSIDDEWIKRPADSYKATFQLQKHVSVKGMTATQRNALQDYVTSITKSSSRPNGVKKSRKFSSTCSSRASIASASTWPLKVALVVKEQAKKVRGRPRNNKKDL